MKPLNEKEVNELSIAVRTHSQHASDYDRVAGEKRWEAENLSADLVAEKPGAAERSRELRLAADDFDVKAAAHRREAKLAQSKLDADRPFRDAADAAEGNVRRKAACEEVYAQARRCDEAAQALAGQLKGFAGTVQCAVAAGMDPHIQHQMLMQYVLQPMLCAAGLSDLKPEWRASPHQSLEQAARSLARA